MSATADQPADLVLISGRIATMDRARSELSAVAVRGAQIMAVGGDEAIRAFVGSQPRILRRPRDPGWY